MSREKSMPLTLGSRLELLSVPDHTQADIAALVERYRGHRDEYQSAEYKEAQLRQEFLNPFFAALGWDMDNKRGYAEPYKEVVHEDSLRVEGAMKAPDYCFRYGGIPKFFVEAKSPSTNVKGDPGPAYQLRRYGWSAHLPLSILTDFEEFTVYDCREKPSPDDAPAHARVAYLTFEQYLDRLPQIYSLFSYEAIPRGVFDRWAESARGKRGTETVDAAFLKEIEGWRDTLARNIALRNDISVGDLNFAVQSLIDRLLFFRIAEDRGVERYGQLREFADQADLYPRLCRLFSQADDKYNSGLFDFSESGDQFTPGLAVDDKVIKPIIADLYYPKSPYEFSVIGADILGAVYEQFLGKVIRLTKGGRAKVEEKPEVKKAGGVYYTPRYIVDYIVEHTVSEAVQVAGTPKKVAALRVLDPACGSGSFLLGAYQWLLNWHLDYYRDHDPEKLSRKRKPVIVPTEAGDWRLSTAERKRILLANIYGVDLDPQAVEVTKLNLLLKCLEGETKRSLEAQLSMFHDRALPNLGSNIKCGNSLIGPDYFTGRLDYDEEERRRVNPFDWEAEFAEIMEAGGFHCVIGNPPYGAALSDDTKSYMAARYPSVADFETSEHFLVQAQGLARANGHVSLIVPNTLLLNVYAGPFRQFLLDHFTISRVANLAAVDVFQAATVRTVIPFMTKGPRSGNEVEFVVFDSPSALRVVGHVEQKALVHDGQWVAGLTGSIAVLIRDRIEGETIPLDDILEVSQGLIPYDKYRGHDEHTIKNRIWHADRKIDGTYRKELRGGDVSRYALNWNGKQWISYGPWLAAPRRQDFFTQPRVLFREITDSESGLLHVAYTEDEYYNNPSIINCISRGTPYSLLYVLGIANSRLIAYLHYGCSPKAQKGLFPKILVKDVRQLPIRPIDFDDSADVARHDQMVTLVERMLDLHKRLPEAKTPQKRQRLEREIRDTDAAIDALVYELYDLTPEEIAIVEGSGIPE